MADRFRFAPAAVMLAVVTAFAAGARAEAIVVRAKPVLLHSFDPSVMRVGRLEYRGGLQLSSADTRFGGLSGLLVSADGRHLTAISDRGYWFEAGLVYDRSGVLAGIDEAGVRELRAPNGKSVARRPAGNAEGLAPAAAGKGVVVSFEMQPKLLLYPAGGGPPVRLKSPPGARAGTEERGHRGAHATRGRATAGADRRAARTRRHDRMGGRRPTMVDGDLADGRQAFNPPARPHCRTATFWCWNAASCRPALVFAC